jgi:hypothetical protein
MRHLKERNIDASAQRQFGSEVRFRFPKKDFIFLNRACRAHLANLTDRGCHPCQNWSSCPAKKFFRVGGAKSTRE